MFLVSACRGAHGSGGQHGIEHADDINIGAIADRPSPGAYGFAAGIDAVADLRSPSRVESTSISSVLFMGVPFGLGKNGEEKREDGESFATILCGC